MPQQPAFGLSDLEGIARVLGDTEEGLSNAEIDRLFRSCQLPDPGPGTKWKRLYTSFVDDQRARKTGGAVVAFIREAINPSRYTQNQPRYETLRTNLNVALAFCGIAAEANGKLVPVQRASSISEARKRARELRDDLLTRGVHPEVLLHCREELLADNYFHAVLEAVKSVGTKIRMRTGSMADGSDLIDAAFSGQMPKLAINSLSSDSERSEQRGFVNLLKGTFGMFRNPTAHEAKILWQMKKEDAEDLLSLVSLIHRRIDRAV